MPIVVVFSKDSQKGSRKSGFGIGFYFCDLPFVTTQIPVKLKPALRIIDIQAIDEFTTFVR